MAGGPRERTRFRGAAIQIREQCVTRGIDIVLHPIDEVQRVRLDHFVGLVVVLSSQFADRATALGPFARLIVDYRARRPEGLESILNGSCEWFDAGVVQVVGRRAIMQHPGMRTALERFSQLHRPINNIPRNRLTSSWTIHTTKSPGIGRRG